MEDQDHSTIPGYRYGDPDLGPTSISDEQLARLKEAAQFGAEDVELLRLAGKVLHDHVSEIVLLWRSETIAKIPHLARHSRSLDGTPLPDYLGRSNRRFEQWIVDTCLRSYDREWLDYQNEIALRHSLVKKNQTDGVSSTPHIRLSEMIPFLAVMNDTIKPFLALQGHPAEVAEGMHRAWCKSMQIQIAIWTETYSALPDTSRNDAEGAKR